MQKILFVIHSLAGGGAEKVLINLVNHMDQTQYDITVLSILGGGINEDSLAEHIHYQVVFPKPFPGNSHFLKLFTPKQLHKLFIKLGGIPCIIYSDSRNGSIRAAPALRNEAAT